MPHVNKYIVVIIAIIVLVAGLIGIYFMQKGEPTNMIEGKFNFKLPSSSKVINYEYHRGSGYFGAKILIDKQSIENVKKDLIEYFKKEYIAKTKENIPNFENNFAWWDLDKKDIEVCYFTFVSGEKKFFGSSPKSRDVWAFVTRDKEGQYYLYISY